MSLPWKQQSETQTVRDRHSQTERDATSPFVPNLRLKKAVTNNSRHFTTLNITVNTKNANNLRCSSILPLDVCQHVDCSISLYIFCVWKRFPIGSQLGAGLTIHNLRLWNTRVQKSPNTHTHTHTQKSLYILYIPEGTSHSHLLFLI